VKKVNQLTVVACSGSILAATLFANSSSTISSGGSGNAQRSTAKPPSVSGSTNTINFAEAKRLAQQSTPAAARTAESSYEERKQQAALARFGCGCEGCASASIGIVEEGQVIQPKQSISTASIHRAPRL
jgi:hypothetical protein